MATKEQGTMGVGSRMTVSTQSLIYVSVSESVNTSWY